METENSIVHNEPRTMEKIKNRNHRTNSDRYMHAEMNIQISFVSNSNFLYVIYPKWDLFQLAYHTLKNKINFICWTF